MGQDIRALPTMEQERQFYGFSRVTRWTFNRVLETYTVLNDAWKAAGCPESEAAEGHKAALAAHATALELWKSTVEKQHKEALKAWKSSGSRGPKPPRATPPPRRPKQDIDMETIFNRPVGERPDLELMKLQFNQLRPVYAPWTSETGHRDCWSQPFVDFKRAITSFMAGTTRFPRFKRYDDLPSFYVANDKLRIEGNYLHIPKVKKPIRLAENLRFNGAIQGVRIWQDSAKDWHVSISVDVETSTAIRIPKYPSDFIGPLTKADRKEQRADARKERVRQLSEGTETFGIDIGIAAAITLSSNETFQPPHSMMSDIEKKTLKKKERRLSRGISRKKETRKARRLALKAAGGDVKTIRRSKNEQRQQVALNKLKRREARKLRDWQHKTTTAIVRRTSPEHGLGMETVSPAKWMQSGMRGWAAKLATIGLGEIRRQIVYKMERASKPVTLFPESYPSTQLCGNPEGCDHRHVMRLDERIYTCEKCGFTTTRDHNGSLNLKPTTWNLTRLSQMTVPSSEPGLNRRLGGDGAKPERECGRSGGSERKPFGGRRKREASVDSHVLT